MAELSDDRNRCGCRILTEWYRSPGCPDRRLDESITNARGAVMATIGAVTQEATLGPATARDLDRPELAHPATERRTRLPPRSCGTEADSGGGLCAIL
jgi:hypothetical protein